jgi:hypothetical protein
MKKAYGRDMRIAKRKISRRKLGPNEQRLLQEISAGDLFVGFLLSCHSVSTMYNIASKRALDRARGRNRAHEALRRLQKKGLLQIIEGADSTRVSITQLGKDELQLSTSNHMSTREWDGLWRVIAFDIPNTNKQLRQEVRILLQTVGYIQVQKSVYVYPYDVPALHNLLAAKNFLASQLVQCTVSKLSDDTSIKKHFKLV